jgi:hypothetical protein
MTSSTPARDFLLPRLNALIADAGTLGIEREVAVAVLIDLVTAPDFDTAEPDPAFDAAPDPNYQPSPDAPMLINGVAVVGPPAIGAQDEADFIRPLRYDQ